MEHIDSMEYIDSIVICTALATLAFTWGKNGTLNIGIKLGLYAVLALNLTVLAKGWPIEIAHVCNCALFGTGAVVWRSSNLVNLLAKSLCTALAIWSWALFLIA